MVDWAAVEGWNPGLDDAPSFLAADASGFFLSRKNGTPCAGISVINHAPGFAFLGLYICAPEFRGQGFGFEIWQHAISHAGSRTIGLDGVPDQQANYAKSGFVLAGETLRWQGPLPRNAESCLQVPNIRQITEVMALDRQQTGFDRPHFLQAWFKDSETRKTRVLVQDGQVTGYGTLRQCLEGYKLGPFSAQNCSDAEMIVADFAVTTRDAQVMIDVPQSSSAMTCLCEEMGLKPGFSTARMYRGPAPAEHLSAYAAVATLELG